MIVRLTTRQWAAIVDHLPKGWLFDWVVNEGRIEEVGKKVEVLMLPDAWRAVTDELIATWFTTGSIRKASAPLFKGVVNVVKETNRRQTHPAFRSLAVVGRQLEVLPAWEYPPRHPEPNMPLILGTDRSPWIPSCDEMPFYRLCDLWPETSRKGGEIVTTWRHANIRRDGVVGSDAYDRFIKARPAAAGSPK